MASCEFPKVEEIGYEPAVLAYGPTPGLRSVEGWTRLALFPSFFFLGSGPAGPQRRARNKEGNRQTLDVQPSDLQSQELTSSSNKKSNNRFLEEPFGPLLIVLFRNVGPKAGQKPRSAPTMIRKRELVKRICPRVPTSRIIVFNKISSFAILEVAVSFFLSRLQPYQRSLQRKARFQQETHVSLSHCEERSYVRLQSGWASQQTSTNGKRDQTLRASLTSKFENALNI